MLLGIKEAPPKGPDHYVCIYQPTEAECEAVWALYEQLKFCVRWGAHPETIAQYEVWLDRELLLSYIED